MADSEIDSFIRKFKLLRGAGLEASLNFETRLGEVSISLNCKVGRDVLPPPPVSPIVASRKRSPSYYRRQVRRKAAREALSKLLQERSLADQAEEEVIAEEASTDDDDEEELDDLVDQDVSVKAVEVIDGDIELNDRQNILAGHRAISFNKKLF